MEILSLSLFAFILVFFMLGIKIVPQSKNYVVERLGRYARTLEAGLHVIIPILETIRHKVDILETQLPTNKISTITLDNVTIEIELAILYRVVKAENAVYRISDLKQAILTTVTGVVRSVIGKTDLDGVQSNRRMLSEAIEEDLRAVTDEWGIVLSRVEIIDVDVDDDTKRAMQLQLNAERNRRAAVRQAEGEKEAAQLQADADLYAAQKQAEAKKTLADAEAYAVSVVSQAISNGGEPAINFEVKKIQAKAIETLGQQKSSKMVLIPSDLLESLTSVAGKFLNK
jgi:regulator of protease activity HflC (stomatin/prohibitin superfamily)